MKRYTDLRFSLPLPCRSSVAISRYNTSNVIYTLHVYTLTVSLAVLLYPIQVPL